MFWNRKQEDNLDFLVDLIYLETATLKRQIEELREEIDYLSDFVGLDD